ncbi:MAG TPA: ring-cleaving dioxygenase [Bryobacteraceae bacterium]|nr:ring-cleaving dioxygenase [Bryobacteraceae bacterium]
MKDPIVGLHHVTAIASDPQRNLDFYTQVLGLRFVKRTVNFDDPGTYHFYFGDDAGSPGTILTFFPWRQARRGHAGAGETTQTAFSVPLESLPFWRQHLKENNVPFRETGKRFEEEVLTLLDPDGMAIEIVGHADAAPARAPRYASIPAEHSIRGFFGVTLLEQNGDATFAILQVMGFQEVALDGRRHRFSSNGNALGNHIDVIVDPKAPWGRQGAGSVHHIAFRVKDDASQLEWQKELSKYVGVTPVRDRTYFHSVYFREPGGVLFELATDPPGFGLDEPAESLGEALRLPEWLEPHRAQLEQVLPTLVLHKAAQKVEA